MSSLPKMLRFSQDSEDGLSRRAKAGEFEYKTSSGEINAPDSSDVNDYIGPEFTAKTFRTWHDSVEAFKIAKNTDGTPALKSMCEAASKRLYNTPAICRSSYVHPDIIKLSERNDAHSVTAQTIRGLRKAEAQMLAFQQSR